MTASYLYICVSQKTNDASLGTFLLTICHLSSPK